MIVTCATFEPTLRTLLEESHCSACLCPLSNSCNASCTVVPVPYAAAPAIGESGASCPHSDPATIVLPPSMVLTHTGPHCLRCWLSTSNSSSDVILASS